MNTKTGENIVFNSESEAARYFNAKQVTISRKILTKHITTKNCKNAVLAFYFCLIFFLNQVKSLTTILYGVHCK